MTEVPEHLLKRSRDRRAALGLGGGGGDEPAAPAAQETGGSAEVEPAAPTAAAKAAAAAPAEVEAAAPPAPLPPYIEAAVRRKRIPFWAMPVLAFLPVWAILYAGSLSPADTGEASPLDLGAEIYATRCASCHGATGGGGVGRQLSGGEVLKTFPTIESMLEFVSVGTAGLGNGTPYGDPAREGGQHVAGSFGQMPAFGESLTDEELLAVVRHERETLSGEVLEGAQTDDTGARFDAEGNPLLSESGELIDAQGNPLLDETGRLVIQIAGTGGAASGQPDSLATQN